jgi:hypothetical protein
MWLGSPETPFISAKQHSSMDAKAGKGASSTYPIWFWLQALFIGDERKYDETYT